MFRAAHFYTFTVCKDMNLPGRWPRLDVSEKEIKAFMKQYKRMLTRITRHLKPETHFRANLYRPTNIRRNQRLLMVNITVGLGSLYKENTLTSDYIGIQFRNLFNVANKSTKGLIGRGYEHELDEFFINWDDVRQDYMHCKARMLGSCIHRVYKQGRRLYTI